MPRVTRPRARLTSQMRKYSDADPTKRNGSGRDSGRGVPSTATAAPCSTPGVVANGPASMQCQRAVFRKGVPGGTLRRGCLRHPLGLAGAALHELLRVAPDRLVVALVGLETVLLRRR